MKPRKGQIVVWGGGHTDEIGQVSRITRDGFYARYTSRFPTVSGGRTHPEKRRLFTWDEWDRGKVWSVR